MELPTDGDFTKEIQGGEHTINMTLELGISKIQMPGANQKKYEYDDDDGELLAQLKIDKPKIITQTNVIKKKKKRNGLSKESTLSSTKRKYQVDDGEDHSNDKEEEKFDIEKLIDLSKNKKINFHPKLADIGEKSKLSAGVENNGSLQNLNSERSTKKLSTSLDRITPLQNFIPSAWNPMRYMNKNNKNNINTPNYMLNKNKLNNLFNDRLVKPPVKLWESSQVNYFNVLLVGEKELGKTSMIELFFNGKMGKKDAERASTVNIKEYIGEIYDEETNKLFKIKFIDTPGYGANKNVSEWYKEIKALLNMKYSEYKKELKKSQKNKKKDAIIYDSRIHCCLYFFSGPRLKTNDVLYMRKLQKRVTLIPILAKGDAYGVQEIIGLKENLKKEASNYQIKWFNGFGSPTNNMSKNIVEGPFGPCPPFMFLSKLDRIPLEGGNFTYGKQFPWGLCDVQNKNHSDYALLADCLLSCFYDDLLNSADDNYDNYKKLRKEKKKKQALIENNKTIGISMSVALGVGFLSALVALKAKFI